MAGADILSADMTTVGHWLHEGWRWWIDELAAVLPKGLRGGRRLPEVLIDPDRPSPPSDIRQRFALLLPSSSALFRRIDRPPVTDRDIGPMLALDKDRLLPIRADDLIIGWRTIERDRQKVSVEIAGLPRASAAHVLETLTNQDAMPTAVLVETGDGSRIDLTRAMRDANMIPGTGAATRSWWALVGVLFALNVGLLIWRDVAATERLRDLVETQQPAVTVARRMMRTIRANDAIGRDVIGLRERRDALAMLDSVSATLPSTVWVQRYAWDGASLRLVGYKRREDDVAAALRKLPGTAAVRSTTADVLADVPAGQPFDVTARIKGG